MRKWSPTRARGALMICSRRWPASVFPTSSSRREGRDAVGLARKRHGARRSDCGRACAGVRLSDRARGGRCRPRRRRGRPGGTGRSGLRSLGGPSDDRARRGRRRRAGRIELADSELPRLPCAGWRGRARPARVPAGVALRHPVAGRSPSRRARAQRREASSCAPTAVRNLRSRRRPRTGGRVPTARGPGLRRLRRRRHLLRRVGVGGTGVRRRGRLRRRRRELGRAGSPAPCPLRPARRDSRPLDIARSEHVPVPDRRDRQHPERGRPLLDGGRGERSARAASSSSSSWTRSHARRRRSTPWRSSC